MRAGPPVTARCPCRASRRRPADHAAPLLGAGLFDVLQLTETDLERTGRYRAEAQRRTGFAAADSTQAFLEGLELRVRVRPADPYSVPRVRNAPAAAFYREAGFTPVAEPGQRYELALEPLPGLAPAWIDLEGETADA